MHTIPNHRFDIVIKKERAQAALPITKKKVMKDFLFPR